MELTVRLTLTPLPDAGPVRPDVGVLVLLAVVGTLLLAFGLAHYTGHFRTLADVWVFSPYLVLACAWLGAGALLALAAVLLISQPAVVAVVLGAVLGLASMVSWVVGVIGVFWLPRPLRPRWLTERLAEDPGRMRTPRRGA